LAAAGAVLVVPVASFLMKNDVPPETVLAFTDGELRGVMAAQ
jgi:hypothetical protein